MSDVNEDGWKFQDPVKTPNRSLPSGFSFGYIKDTNRRSCLVWYGDYGVVVDNKRLIHLSEGETMPETVERPTRKAPEEPVKKAAAAAAGEKAPKIRVEKQPPHPDVAKAKEAYDGALERLDKAIKTSQAAREASQADKDNADLKQKMIDARSEHQAALKHIKEVRPKYQELKAKHSAPVAKTPAQKEAEKEAVVV